MPRTVTRQPAEGEAEAEAPRRLHRDNGSGNGASPSVIRRGWAAHREAKSRVSKFDRGDQFSLDKDEEKLIHFMEDEPLASWNEHWINEITDGKKSFVCDGEDCPLCAFGLKATYRDAWNIVTFDSKGNPSVKYWIASPDPAEKIEEKHANARTSPLDRSDLYFAVSKTKAKGRGFSFNLEAIDASTLPRNFGFDPLDETELAGLAKDMFAPDDVVRASTRRELNDVIDSLED